MHISVCMDIAADRKQLERLLGRSADKRMAEDDSIPLYIQSYGNKEAILKRSSMYDLFFIGITEEEGGSLKLARELRSRGVTSRIVLYLPEEGKIRQEAEKDKFIFLKYPVISAELEEILNVSVEEVKSRLPRIEIRTETETFHFLPEEFLYAERKKREHIIIHLSDGRLISSKESMDNFWEHVEGFGELYFLPEHLIVNIGFVKECGLFSVKLKDKRRFFVNRAWLKYMLEQESEKENNKGIIKE